jgi:hypothetical protein
MILGIVMETLYFPVSPTRKYVKMGDPGGPMAKFLFTMMPANDLGLPSRLVPIARALADRGHEVAMFNPAPAPSKLIAEVRLQNSGSSKKVCGLRTRSWHRRLGIRSISD